MSRWVFILLQCEVLEILDLPDPDVTPASSRTPLRLDREVKDFSDEHYLADHVYRSSIDEVIAFETFWERYQRTGTSGNLLHILFCFQVKCSFVFLYKLLFWPHWPALTFEYNRNGMKLLWREGRWKNGREVFKAKQRIRFYVYLSSWTCVQLCESCDYRDVGFVFIFFYIKLHWWLPFFPPLPHLESCQVVFRLEGSRF